MLAACATPDLITEITLQPVRRYGVDAAILFSDIVVPLEAIGRRHRHRAGRRPGGRPARSGSAATWRGCAPSTGRRARASPRPWRPEQGAECTPLIGFAGGPFTLASYLVDGGPSKNFEKTKALMYGNPELWAPDEQARRHHDRLPAGAGRGRGAGGAAVRLLGGRAQPRRLPAHRCCRYSKRIFDALAGPGVPRIHFGVDTGELLGLMGEAGADVVGVDWRVPLDEAVRRVEPGKALQGNLDPASCWRPGRSSSSGRARCSTRPHRRGPHLQPRSRRAARDRPGRADQADRARAHGIRPASLTAATRVPPVRRIRTSRTRVSA